MIGGRWGKRIDVLDDLRFVEVVGLHAGVELGRLDADPLFGDYGDNVVPTHYLFALPPQVVHAQLHVRHPCTRTPSQWTGMIPRRHPPNHRRGYSPLRNPRKKRRTRAICFCTQPSASCSTNSSSTAVIWTCRRVQPLKIIRRSSSLHPAAVRPDVFRACDFSRFLQSNDANYWAQKLNCSYSY